MQYFLVQNKIVRHKEYKDIEHCIESPASRVTKSLRGDELSEGGIKKIYKRNNHLFWHNPQIPGAKLIERTESVNNKYYFCVQFNLKWSLYPALNRLFRQF